MAVRRDGGPGARILVVEDDPALRELLTYNLEQAGFAVLSAGDGRTALEVAQRDRPDLVVLDLMLPGLDGLEVCRRLRRTSAVPILILSARREEVDRVLGLELGADDYLTKPFSPRELVARVRAILRRAGPGVPAEGGSGEGAGVLTFGPLVIDPGAHRVSLAGREVGLTPTEFRLLLVLASNPGRVLSRQELLEQLWGTPALGELRTVDVHVLHLREKLGESADSPGFIQTVRGVGYRFRAPPDGSPAPGEGGLP